METGTGQDDGFICCLFQGETLQSMPTEKQPGPSAVHDKFIINDRPDVENTTYTHAEMKSSENVKKGERKRSVLQTGNSHITRGYEREERC